MENFFIHIYHFFSRHKTAYWLTLFSIIAVCVALSLRISFEEDISKMLDGDPETQEMSHLIQNSKMMDRILFSVRCKNDNGDKDSMIAIAENMTAEIQTQCGEYLKGIRAQIEQDEISTTYNIITQNFTSFIPEKNFHHTLDNAFRPQRLDSTINGYLRIIGTPGGMFVREAFVNDPAGLTLPLFEQLRELQSSAQFKVIDNYLFSSDEQNLIIFLFPKYNSSETKNNTKLVEALDEIVHHFRASPEGKNFEIQYFGSVVVAVGNAQRIQKDTYITIIFVSVVLLILLLSIFQKKRLPLLIMSTVGFGFLFSLAMVSLFVDSMSLIAIGTGAIILAVAVDYPIHFFTHYLYNHNISKTIKSLIIPLAIGSSTTIGGFLCLTLTNSALLKDFGLFGAFCLLGAVLFSLIFLPHLAGSPKIAYKPNFIKRGLEKISRLQLDRKPFFIALIFVLTPVLFYFSFQVEYEDDLGKLNYMSNDLKESEKKFLALSENKNNLFLITKGATVEDVMFNSYNVMSHIDSLQKTGINCYFSGVVRAIPPKQVQQNRVDLWNSYWNDNEKIDAKRKITDIFLKKEIDTTQFSRFFASLNGEESIISEENYHYLMKTFGSDFLSEEDTLCTLISQVKVSLEYRDLLVDFIHQNPTTIVIDQASISENLAKSVSDNFNIITILTSLLVFVIILFAYGRIELALIAFIPMVVSWIWILGFMALFSIKFNIVNIILSTFIFGLGADFCVFTNTGYLKYFTKKENNTTTIRMGVLLSAFTSLIGLGSLMFAKHPAMHSLGAISVVGILSVLFISQTLQPFLFRILADNPTRKGHAPISLLTIVNSCFTFAYFFITCILASVVSLILAIVPIKKRHKKRILHQLKYYIMRGLVYGDFVIKKVKQNPYNETFTKPGIIISNHQSMLDILYLLCLHPKIVIVVKSWVWNSPIMGIFVRMAGFHSIDHGTENNLESYRKTLDEGYSIAVFPEGSRSNGRSVNRFHKGAFFLAEKLQADLIPVVIQHNHETLPRDSFAVHPNQMTMRIYDRILPNDTTFGNSYQERTKLLSKWYKTEYVTVGEETANARYCLRRLKDAYMFHGPILESYLRVKVRLENSYDIFEKMIPRKASIVDVGCGYGFLSFTLAARSHERKIFGIDYDEEKIVSAKHTFICNEQLDFEHADIINYDFPVSDCFVLSDVLHYLTFEQTQEVMKKITEKLNKNGKIIVRDADIKEHRFNRISEFLSTKVFKFNKADKNPSFFSAEKLNEYMGKLGFEAEMIHASQKSINTLIVFQKRIME